MSFSPWFALANNFLVNYNMNELRKQIEHVLLVSSNPIRLTEHTVFHHLIYRNTSQHRHGLYFRRLQHVKRLLKYVASHAVWNSLQQVVGPAKANDPGFTAKPRRKNGALALSTLTRDDMDDVLQVLDQLVDTIIPAAARSIAIHLAARNRFFTFTVVFSACLARLFVTERALRNALRSVSLNLNVLLAGTEGPTIRSNATAATDEDVGIIVSPQAQDTTVDTLESVLPLQKVGENSANDGVHYENDDNYRVEKTQEEDDTQALEFKDTPYLHDVLVRSGVSTETLSKLDVGTPVTMPKITTSGQLFKASISKNRKRKVSTTAVATATPIKQLRLEEATPNSVNANMTLMYRVKSSLRETTTSATLNANSLQHISKAKKQLSHDNDSDSEDLDDIFGVLD